MKGDRRGMWGGREIKKEESKGKEEKEKERNEEKKKQ